MKEAYYDNPKFMLYRANCLSIFAGLPENYVDMIFADPPSLLPGGGSLDNQKEKLSQVEWFEKDSEFHNKWIKECRRILKPDGTIWISGSYRSIYYSGHALLANKFHILNDIVWFKMNAAPNYNSRNFAASHETLIWARKDKNEKHFFDHEEMKNGDWSRDELKKPGFQMHSVWSIGVPRQIEKKFGKQSGQKPEDLLKRIVLASTKKGDLILDPFTGSSTTGIIAYLFGRNFIGIDIEKKYLDTSIRRFEDLDKNMKKRRQRR